MSGQLVNQPSKLPTRKLGAVILVTFLIQGGVGVAEHFFPGISGSIPAAQWIETLVPLLVGYFVRDRAA